ncbi:MAG TPA: tetratricopeptide repeat protein [Blastocatellia bacterium]|nr:tetratricopeptide repeat protein [Blastocatellia bacterium]
MGPVRRAPVIMAQSPTKNAIEKRLDYLGGLWNEFAQQEGARLLRWLVDADDAQMLDLFFETQDEQVSEVPDLFVRLTTPFETAGEYGAALTADFKSMYEETRQALAEIEIDHQWAVPEPVAADSGMESFVRCLGSFQQHYADLMLKLVIVLRPESIADPAAWQAWLSGLLKAGPADRIRLTVVDRLDVPMLEELAAASPTLVMTVRPQLDMPGAISELVHQAGGSGPGVEFRRLFIELTNLVGSGNLEAINRKARAAIAIAGQEQWHSLAAAIHTLLAAAHLRAGRTEESVAAYRSAGQSAEAARAEDDPAGVKLMIQSRFGEAAALLSAGRFDQAVQVYEQIVPLTREARESLMTLEALRMAGYCYEQLQQPPRAWRSYRQALDSAEELDETTRRNSTLPYIGQGLLRLAGPSAESREAREVRARMVELVGPDWEERIETGDHRA